MNDSHLFSCWPGSGYPGHSAKPRTKLLNNSATCNGSSLGTTTFTKRLVPWPPLPLPGNPGPRLSVIRGLGGKQASGRRGGRRRSFFAGTGTALGAVCSSPSQLVHCEHPPPSRPTGPGCWDHWQAAYYSCLSHPTLLEASTNPSPGRVRAEKTPVLEAVSRLFSHLK